jgi:hypothetical protein
MFNKINKAPEWIFLDYAAWAKAVDTADSAGGGLDPMWCGPIRNYWRSWAKRWMREALSED